MPTTNLDLWQTEWCPASHRVRQRLTELGLNYIAHQVPVDSSERSELEAATGQRTIPVLLTADGEILRDEAAIMSYLDSHYPDPPDAITQRKKAARAKQKELERACPKFTAATGGIRGTAVSVLDVAAVVSSSLRRIRSRRRARSTLQIERAEAVQRTVETPDGRRVAIDALVRMARPRVR